MVLLWVFFLYLKVRLVFYFIVIFLNPCSLIVTKLRPRPVECL